MALLFGLTVLVSLAAFLIRQPLVIAYIVAGVLVGPYALGWLKSSNELELFSKVGVVFLLFSVGLHLNPQVLKEVGLTATLTGVGQIVFTTLAGLALAALLGWTGTNGLIIAVALTFSSTIIILKLISDRQDLDKLYAKISIGFLLVQDIAATLILVLLPLIVSAGQSDVSLTTTLSQIALRTVVVATLIGALTWQLLPRILPLVARSSELLFILSLSWGIGVAAAIGWAGVSVEVGALLAGVLLASSPFATEISSRLKPLRDFFIVSFFLLLGSSLAISSLGAVILPAVVLSLFVLIGNPLIVYIIMQLLGHTRKVSFQAGLTVAQISEFSLIFVALANQVLELSLAVVSLVTVVGVITIVVSTYMILYADTLFRWIEPVLKRISLPSLTNAQPGKTGRRGHNQATVLWFGTKPALKHLQELADSKQYKLVVVDYDPNQLNQLSAPHIHTQYGDASNVEFLDQLPWHEVTQVVSVIRDDEINTMILSYANQHEQITSISVLARNSQAVSSFRDLGAHHVVDPIELSVAKLRRLAGL